MATSEPLDMREIDPPVWRLIVSDRIYGPYTLGQLRVFILDGRINVRSKIVDGDGGQIRAAGDFSQLAPAFEERMARARPRSFSNFVIISERGSDPEPLIDILNEIGAFAAAMEGVFLLRSELRLAEIQSRISEALPRDEKIMIVDASRDRLGWLGLGFDASDHVRAVWNKAA